MSFIDDLIIKVARGEPIATPQTALLLDLEVVRLGHEFVEGQIERQKAADLAMEAALNVRAKSVSRQPD